MGKIYSGIEEIKKPDASIDNYDFDKYNKSCDDYVTQIKEWCKRECPECAEAGEEIHFGVADGRARYVVLNLKPVELIHLDIMDGYNYQYVHRLTAKDVRAELKRNRAIEEIFSKR